MPFDGCRGGAWAWCGCRIRSPGWALGMEDLRGRVMIGDWGDEEYCENRSGGAIPGMECVIGGWGDDAATAAPNPAPGDPLPTMSVPFRVIRRADGVRPHSAPAEVAGPWTRSPGADPRSVLEADDWDSPVKEDW